MTTTALSADQGEAWRTDGFLVVEDIFDHDEVHVIQDESRVYFPSREEYDALEDRTHLEHFVWLPFAEHALNVIPFDPRVLAVAEQLLETTDLRMRGSEALHGRYAGPRMDQPLHLDYDTLLTP